MAMAAAAAFGRLAARRIGTSGGAPLRRTATLLRFTHTEAATIGKAGEQRWIQEKKEELYDRMAAAVKKGDISGYRETRLLRELSAHVKRHGADLEYLQVGHAASVFFMRTGMAVLCAGLLAGSTVAVANAVVWLSYACSGEQRSILRRDA